MHLQANAGYAVAVRVGNAQYSEAFKRPLRRPGRISGLRTFLLCKAQKLETLGRGPLCERGDLKSGAGQGRSIPNPGRTTTTANLPHGTAALDVQDRREKRTAPKEVPTVGFQLRY